MKRVFLPAVAVLLFPASAEAISRYNAATMTCERVQSLVTRHGEVLFDFRSRNDPNVSMFNRFVAHGNFCPKGQYVAADFIPTANNPYCPLQVCRDLTGRDSRGGGAAGSN